MPPSDKPPYVGRRIYTWQSMTGHALPAEGVCLDHVGDMICVRDDAGAVYWADTRRIPGFKIIDEPSDAPDSVTAADFPGLESRYGSVEVKVADGPDKAG